MKKNTGKKGIRLFAYLIVCWIVLIGCEGEYEPPEQNIPISSVENDQESPSIITNAASDSIIVWHDYRNISCDIFAQKVDENKIPLWNKNGVPVTEAPNGQVGLVACLDDSGGIIVAWQDSRYHDFDIYAQRIDINGNQVWTKDGVLVSFSGNVPAIIPDGAGGAIIAWDDGADVFAQRIDSNGALQWTENGVCITAATGSQFSARIVSDCQGGAIISWLDERIMYNNPDIYAQRINSDGEILWAENGIPVCTEESIQTSHVMAAGGSGDAVIVWEDLRSTFGDVYAQRIDGNGTAQWAENGIPIAAYQKQQSYPQIVTPAAGYYIISWVDYRDSTNRVYAQKYDDSGTTYWTEGGVAVFASAGELNHPHVALNNDGGIFVVSEIGSNIWCQRINSDGVALWQPGGVAVSTAAETQWYPKIAPVNNYNGAIIVWTDYRNDKTILDIDVYGDYINADGSK